MKSIVLVSMLTLICLPARAAGVADEVKAAAEKLAQQPNYTWTVKTEPQRAAGGTNRTNAQTGEGRQRGQGRGGFAGGFGAGMPAGQTERDGFTVLTYRFGSNTTQAVLKGRRVALKNGDEWQTGEELADAAEEGTPNRSRFMVRRVQQFKTPAVAAQELLGRVTDLKQEGEVYFAELTPAAIKEMFSARGRPGQGRQGQSRTGTGEGPALDTTGLNGSAKFWVKDGLLMKYQTHIEGKMPTGRENRQIDVKRTTTVEIKDVGTTKVIVPAEAKKKLTAH
jgi:hypothetical protein